MPRTTVVFYSESDGSSPVFDFLQDLRARNASAYFKCFSRIERLGQLGHELRRPEADFLRDGIHELRARLGTPNYRILYFISGRTIAVLAHALTKESAVLPRDIDFAVRRMRIYLAAPARHTFARPSEDEDADE